MNDRKILRSTWNGMKSRCLNPKNSQYHNYGGRGIAVCDRWLNSFEAFCQDMGPRPAGMTLDRFPNNDGHYEPGNCRWATPAMQSRNQRTNHYIEFGGRRMVLRDWANELGMSELTLGSRLDRLGWSVEKALTTPPLSSEEAASIGRSAQVLPSRRIQRNNGTGYKGVSYHKGNRRYRAQINHMGKQRHIGEFDTPEEAAHAYNKASVALHGDRAILNPVGGIFISASKEGV